MTINPDNFIPGVSLPTDFKPSSFQSIPSPNLPIFDRQKFLTAELHERAESVAREQIRSELSKKNGGAIVYGQHELVYGRGSNRGQEIFENIRTGKAIVR